MKTPHLSSLLFISIVSFLVITSSCKEWPKSAVHNCCNTEPLVDSIGLAKIFIPNTFTPDQNGFNDRFLVYNNGMIKKIKLMQIFNLTGIKVFEKENFNDLYSGWDGKSYGTEIPGLYTYKITIESDDNVEKTVEGKVCCLPCSNSPRDFHTFENIDNCIFGLQHNGAGNYDSSLQSGEYFNCLE